MFRRLCSSTCLLAVLAFGWTSAAPVMAQDGLAGAYLAARVASGHSDYEAAAEYYTKALARDTSNASLLEGALISQMALGNLDAATPIARRMHETVGQSSVAELILVAEQLKRGDYAGVISAYEEGREIGPLVDGLVIAWSELARGNVGVAMEAFDKIASDEALSPFGNYHKALALALVGDFEGADALFALAETGKTQLTRRGVIAHVQILGQLDRSEDALALLDKVFGADPDPQIVELRAALTSGNVPAFTEITDPAEGLSEVFFSVATVLGTQAEDTYTLLYSRIAEALVPTYSSAILLSAEILERQGQYELASAAYNMISRDDPAFHMAEIGRAEALRELDKTEAAIEVLEQLVESYPTLPTVHRALAELLRSQERYADAVISYDAAIETLTVEDESHWVLYYARGIAHERLGQWTEAEADFRKALDYKPDQPGVLNYLGYSFLERGENFDEALAMIQRAVSVRPNDGAIVDSFGWALYRLGRYEEAVAPMEKAASLLAVDPVINDHLGDVYWAVGRHVEAQFQWRRALSFDPEEEEAERIRRKLEVGLDAVLEEEGAEPLAVAHDGG